MEKSITLKGVSILKKYIKHDKYTHSDSNTYRFTVIAISKMAKQIPDSLIV